MKVLEALQGYLRQQRLSRQLRRIERLLVDYDQGQRRKLAHAMAREMKAAAACPEPVRYQSSRRSAARPWGDGLDLAWSRVKSANGEVRVCGIALWLAIGYHEAGAGASERSQDVYRRIVRISRELREFLEPDERAVRASFGARRVAAGA